MIEQQSAEDLLLLPEQQQLPPQLEYLHTILQQHDDDDNEDPPQQQEPPHGVVVVGDTATTIVTPTTTTSTTNEIELDDDELEPIPWSPHHNNNHDRPYNHHNVDDDEEEIQLLAALQSLDLGGSNSHPTIFDHKDDDDVLLLSLVVDDLKEVFYDGGGGELPELEFTGDDDPILQSFLQQLNDDNDGNDNNNNDLSLWANVFDDHDDNDIVKNNNNNPIHIVSNNSGGSWTATTTATTDALDLLQQLEQLNLVDEDEVVGDNDFLFKEEEEEDYRYDDVNDIFVPHGDTFLVVDPFLEEEVDKSSSNTIIMSSSLSPSEQLLYPTTTTNDNAAKPPVHNINNNSNNDSNNENPRNDWLCQPCNDPNSIPPPSFLSTPLTEEQAWILAAAAVYAEQQQQDDEHDDYDPRSGIIPFLNHHTNNDHHDEDDEDDLPYDDDEPLPLSTTATARTDDASQEQQQRTTTSTTPRVGALEAAQPFAAAFGVSLLSVADQPQEQGDASSHQSSSVPTTSIHRRKQQQQRECYGHKERILGCDFSACGNYLATASQDATIRIWSCTTNRQLSILQGHSKEHECLRVTWASSNWAQDQICRSQQKSTTTTTATSTLASSYPYLLASSGADGVVHLWGCNNPDDQDTWTNYATLDHSTYLHYQTRSSNVLPVVHQTQHANNDKQGTSSSTNDDGKVELDDDKPQIYSLQFIDHWMGLPTEDYIAGVDDGDKTSNRSNSFLLTSSDEYIHLWELDETQLNKKSKKDVNGSVSKELHLREVMSLRFGDLNGPAYGVTIQPVTETCVLTSSSSNAYSTMALQTNGIKNDEGNNNNVARFGGERNVKNIIFVFDASYSTANGLLGAALSDGTLRLVNGRGVCLSVLQLPGCQSHLTSFSWDSKGERLATTVATGHLITWGIEVIHSGTVATTGVGDAANMYSSHRLLHEGIRASCCAVMEGGHTRGRPLYGTKYVGTKDDLLLSWGSDGRVCLWDSRVINDEIDEPLAILWDNYNTKTGSAVPAVKAEDGYPVYAVSVSTKTRMTQEDESSTNNNNATSTVLDSAATPRESNDDDDDESSRYKLTIAIAGGGSVSGFLGIPLFLTEVTNLNDDKRQP